MGDRHGLLASTRTPAKRAGEVGALVATLQPAPCSRRAFSWVHFGTWMFAVWLRVWLHVWLFDFSGDGTPSQAPGHGNKKRPRLESGVIGDRAHTGAMSESVSLWGETERTVEQGEEQSDFQPTLDFTVTFPPPARWAWVGSLSRHKDYKDTRRKGRRRQITCAGALYRAEAVSSVWRLKGTPSWVGRRDRAS